MADPTRTKTIQVATYPDGHRVPIIREHGMWTWNRTGSGISQSSHKDSALAQAREAGATITREPNPNYKPRLRHFERLMRGL